MDAHRSRLRIIQHSIAHEMDRSQPAKKVNLWMDPVVVNQAVGMKRVLLVDSYHCVT